ncbi:MAG: hypothetical protein IJG33_07320 [Selenomonadaceae bacterium]|nr:hypothetical protein [Selenomonadaceae bacterium]
MKKFFLTLILLLITAQVEAVPFTRTQLDNIFLNVEQNNNSATFNLNSESFQAKFNAIITPILKQAMQTDDVSAVEYLFLIKDYKIIGNTFANMFGDYRVMIVANCAEGGNFKEMSFCFTTPEERDESLFTVLLISAFVECVAPGVDPQTLMNELSAEGSPGSVIKNNVKFSLTADNNLNSLIATPNQ